MAVDRQAGLKRLRAKLKDGALQSLSEQRPLEVISSGIATLDAALGVGGFVRGGQYIIWGSPSSGKTATALTAMGNLMSRDADARVCVIDIERSQTPEWAAKFGCDPKRMDVVREPTVEDAVNSSQDVLRSCAYDYVLVDSLGAVTRSADFDGKDGQGGDANKAQVGGSAGVITRWVNKVNSELIVLDKLQNCGEDVIKPVVIYINQARDNLKSMYGGLKMSGGHALEHMADVIIRLSASASPSDRLTGTVGRRKEEVGTRVTATIEKNKFAPPKRQAGWDFCWEESEEYGFGIDSVVACFDLAVELGVVEAKGAWFCYGDAMKAQGRKGAIEAFRADPSLYASLYNDVMGAVEDE